MPDLGERALGFAQGLKELLCVAFKRAAREGRGDMIQISLEVGQRAPGMEAGRARVGMRRRLRLARRLEHGRPFVFEESEKGHGTVPLKQTLIPTDRLMHALKESIHIHSLLSGN